MGGLYISHPSLFLVHIMAGFLCTYVVLVWDGCTDCASAVSVCILSMLELCTNLGAVWVVHAGNYSIHECLHLCCRRLSGGVMVFLSGLCMQELRAYMSACICLVII